MAINYPTSLDALTNPVGTNTLDSPDHATQHANANDILEALEAKVGVGAGTPVANQVMVGSGNGTASWSGTWNQATFGSPTVTGGTINSVVMGTPTVTGGTFNSVTLGTPVIDRINSSGTTAVITAGAGLAPTVGTLTDAVGTITPNAAIAQVFELSMGTAAGNRTLAVPINPTGGQAISYRIKQNTGNTGTVVYASGYKMNNGGTPVLGTASTWNYVGFRYYTAGTAWHHQGNSLGII